jgi:Na+/H+-dicarboxylate symporter
LSSAFVAVNVLGNALATIVVARWERGVSLPVLDLELRRAATA